MSFMLFLLALPACTSAGLFQRKAEINIQSNLQLPDDESQFEVLVDSYPHRSLQSTDRKEKPYFKVREIEREFGLTSPSDVHIKIYNHSPDKWYSVTIVAQNEYTGVANFLRRLDDRPGNPLLYSWIPKMSGRYEIIVHELNTNGLSDKTPPMDGEYRFDVIDKAGVDSRQILLEQIVNMPPCQSVNRGDLYTVWDGTWLGPQLHGHVSGMRNGWYFLPSSDMNCKIEYFTDADLRRNNDERSIYILGSSKERGVFLSLVDMLLDSDEKELMEQSVISKCWGRAHVRKSNIKVLYQDFRSTYFEHAGASSDYLCHNEKVVREGGGTYTINGMRVWEEMFEDDPVTWPSVILMSASNDEGFNKKYDLQHFINTLPSSWQGTLLLTDGTFSAMKAGSGDEAEYIKYRSTIKELVAGLNDSRVRWIDGKGVSKEMRLYGERGPDYVIGSQHFHGHCEATYLDESGQQQDMRICSNVTEVLGQLLIGYALGPKNEYNQRLEQTAYANNENNQAVYCHACPEDLLPFHITHHPDMTCAIGALHPRVKSEIHNGFPQMCPKPCLNIPPYASRQTQSGVVQERYCPVKYFTQEDPQVEKLNKISKELDQMEDQMKHIYRGDRQGRINHAAGPANVKVRRRADISTMEIFIPQEEEYLSLYSFCMINMVILLGLTAVYKSKVKALMRQHF